MKATHNSLTFARPAHKWAYLGIPFWKCQTKNITQQITQAGCRAFDIRFAPLPSQTTITQRVSGIWRSAHGAIDLDIDPVEQIETIARLCPQGAFVRLILEKGDSVAKENFRTTCRMLQRTFPQLTFYGGNYKPTWEYVYTFNDPAAKEAERTLVQHCGSMQSTYGKICPALWKLFNKNTPEQAHLPTLPIVALDFV